MSCTENLTVDKVNNYYITDKGILVHNQDPISCIKRYWKVDDWAPDRFGSKESTLSFHFTKHGNEVGIRTVDDYSRKAIAYRDQFLNSRRSVRSFNPKSIEGHTPNTTRYYFNDRYIDLAENNGEKLIVSFGKRGGIDD